MTLRLPRAGRGILTVHANTRGQRSIRARDMQVFISWSGQRSEHITKGLAEFLPDVLQLIKPFTSQANINAGTRWPTALNEALESSKFGIIVLTPENQREAWLLFEAGALGIGQAATRRLSAEQNRIAN